MTKVFSQRLDQWGAETEAYTKATRRIVTCLLEATETLEVELGLQKVGFALPGNAERLKK